MHVKLHSGRAIYLRELHQVSVYEGVLEGYPTRDGNTRLVASLVSRLTERFDMHPLVVEPDEHLLDRPQTPRGIAAKIPHVGSAGRFESLHPARDASTHASTLLVLWFQDEFGLPDARSLEKLRGLDWDAHALDFNW